MLLADSFVRLHPADVVQLFPLLAWDVVAHVPRVGQGEERLRIHVLDVGRPLLRRLGEGFEDLDAFVLHLLDGRRDPVSLAFDDGHAVRQRGRRFVRGVSEFVYQILGFGSGLFSHLVDRRA